MFNYEFENPGIVLAQLSSSVAFPRVLQEAAHLKLGHYVSDGPKSLGQIAEHYGFNENVLSMFLDILVANNILEESENFYYPTMMSDSLDLIDQLFFGIESWQCWSQLDKCLVSGKPVFNEIFGMSFYSYLKQHPNKNGNWQQWNSITTEEWFSQISQLLDLSGTERICDVGGGNGVLLRLIALEYPTVECTVFDLPDENDYLDPNVSKIDGDMFVSIPPGFDIYILSRVFCNWNDAEMKIVLANLKKAMNDDAKLVVIDGILPERDDPERGNYVANNLNLFLMFGAKLRQLGEFHELMNAVDFKITAEQELKTLSDLRWKVLIADCC
ncbi:MAG: hypothetical protein GKR91_08540 [Pseudomonadales bacterium]|nr:hypothetical protein [Pseudomonadales bacterium]